jgi:hypothetical protein
MLLRALFQKWTGTWVDSLACRKLAIYPPYTQKSKVPVVIRTHGDEGQIKPHAIANEIFLSFKIAFYYF